MKIILHLTPRSITISAQQISRKAHIPLWRIVGLRNLSGTTARRKEYCDTADIEARAVMVKGQKFDLKVPKGTKDWSGPDMVIRDKIFTIITEVFKRHGAVTIDTPVFELKEILAGKYGEDSKLIYDLADQGGEICSLRYDLTVPFARWLAMNQKIQHIKRYHIAKVYRRDQPAMTKGRMREFYQCDFDIAGQFDSMLPDAEIVRIITEVFDGLGWKGQFTIKLNNRKILDGLFQVCGVPEEKIRTISSAVDKLDKSPWSEVRREMMEDKGLAEDVADKIGEYVVLKGGKGLLSKLNADENLMANESMKAGLEEMGTLFDYLEAFDCLDAISFDLSLARGLDYYTGVIYEVVTDGSAPRTVTEGENFSAKPPKKSKSGDADEDRSSDPSVGVGSIAAGGRYDKLVGMFSGKKEIPCVGISFGVDRIFSITKAKLEAEKNQVKVRKNEVDVYVMAFGGKGFTGLVKERLSVCSQLWSADIKAEFAYKVKPKFDKQFNTVDDDGIPFSVILGEDEVARGEVKVKENGLPKGHPEKDGLLVKLEDVVPEVKKRLERKARLDKSFTVATDRRVVSGMKSEAEKVSDSVSQEAVMDGEPAKEGEAVKDDAVAVPTEETETKNKKPEAEGETKPLQTSEVVGAVPTS